MKKMRFFLTLFICICLVGQTGYAAPVSNYYPESAILKDVFVPFDVEDLACGYIIFEDGTGAELSYEDAKKYLDSHLSFCMERYTQPYDPAQMTYPYFNFYAQDGSGCTFFRMNALCAGFGDNNYIWYRPYVGNAQNMLSDLVKKLEIQYRPQAEAMQQPPVFPVSEALALPNDAWAAAEVMEAAQRNLVPVALTDRYSEEITREEFCRLIGQTLAQIHKPNSSSHIVDMSENLKEILYEKTGSSDIGVSYTDCDDSVIHILTALGIINGRGDGTFDPKGGILREEAAKILYCTAILYGEQTPGHVYYSDLDCVSPWASEAVAWAKNEAVMLGIGGDYFGPRENLTIEQAIVSVNRLFHFLSK